MRERVMNLKSFAILLITFTSTFLSTVKFDLMIKYHKELLCCHFKIHRFSVIWGTTSAGINIVIKN